MQDYLINRIDNKIYSKISYYKHQVKYYFEKRHRGLANLDNDQVYSLAFGAIRDLRIWEEIRNRIYFSKIHNTAYDTKRN